MNKVLVKAFCVAGFLTLAVCTAAGGATLPYNETFTAPNGASWPSPWFAGSSHVTVWDVQGNRGRLNGDPVNVARMILPGYTETNVEILATFEFENVGHQGIGFYARQNGGSLQEYVPYGQGYAVFLKGNWAWPEDLGIWREINGVETQFAVAYDPIAGGLLNNTRYRVRFRVTQVDPDTTLLQSRVWPEAAPEPSSWNVEVFDTEPLLQGTAGSFAIDIYNQSGTSHVFLDDISINRYPLQTAVPDRPRPASISLSEPYPHPVTGTLRVDLNVPDGVSPRLSVFDISGRRVARPLENPGPGSRTLTWNPLDEQGRRLTSGTYFLRVEAPGSAVVRKFVIAE